MFLSAESDKIERSQNRQGDADDYVQISMIVCIFHFKFQML